MMKRALVLIGVVFGVAGCAPEAESVDDTYSEMAANLEAISAALESGTTDEDADEALSDDSMERVRSAVRHRRRGHRHHGRGHDGRHGRQGQLLAMYGDLDAIQACRDLRDTCVDSDDTDCRGEVRDCVRDVLQDAVAAMCDEGAAMCTTDAAPSRECGRIEATCSRDGGSFGGFKHGSFGGARPDKGARGDGGIGHRDGNRKGRADSRERGSDANRGDHRGKDRSDAGL